MKKDILKNSERILMPRLDTHGDILLLQGFLAVLLDKYGDIEITLLVREGYDQLRDLFPQRIKWIITKASGYILANGNNLVEVEALLDVLHGEKWDCLLTTNYNQTWLDDIIAARLHGINRISIGKPKESTQWLTDFLGVRNIHNQSLYDQFVSVDEFSHETDKYQVLWNALTGNKGKLPDPSLDIPESIMSKGEEILRGVGVIETDYCVCVPAGTNNITIKAWAKSNFVDVVQWLEKQLGLRSLIIGNEKERECLEAVMSIATSRGCSPALWIGKEGELPIATALIKNAKLYFGNDTGLMHIASAVGTDVIAIFGGGHWPRFLPKGKACVVVRELPCFRCDWQCIFDDALCVKFIGVNDIKKAFTVLHSKEKNNDDCTVMNASISYKSMLEEIVPKTKDVRNRLLANLGAIQGAISEKEELIKHKNNEIVDKDSIIRQKDEIIRQRDEGMKKKDEFIKQRDEAIRRKDEIIRQRDEGMKKKDEFIKQRDEAIRRKDEIIRQKDEILRERDYVIQKQGETIVSFQNSWSFRITRPLRAIKRMFS